MKSDSLRRTHSAPSSKSSAHPQQQQREVRRHISNTSIRSRKISDIIHTSNHSSSHYPNDDYDDANNTTRPVVEMVPLMAKEVEKGDTADSVLEEEYGENEEEDVLLVDDSTRHKYNHHHHHQPHTFLFVENRCSCFRRWCSGRRQSQPCHCSKIKTTTMTRPMMIWRVMRIIGLGIMATAMLLLFGHFTTTTTTDLPSVTTKSLPSSSSATQKTTTNWWMFASTTSGATNRRPNNNNYYSRTRDQVQNPKSILLALNEKQEKEEQQRMQLPNGWDRNDDINNADGGKPDYGNLTLTFVTDPTQIVGENVPRRLQRHDDRYLDFYREDLFAQYFDKDPDEEAFWGYGDAYPDPRKACVWPRRVYSPTTTCNTFHELDFIHPYGESNNYHNTTSSTLQFLGSGYYRRTWLVRTPHDEYVIKRQNIKRRYDRNRYQKIVTEAFIMEQLTSSPRISDIYGHCGFSIMVEAALYDMDRSIYGKAEFQTERGKIKQEILDAHQIHDVYTFNNYTAHEKLDLLIQMTESIADTHGLPTGPVVSGDVAVNQWLLAKDGHRLILNDFDSAILLAFNFTSRQYCPYSSGFVGGFKAPEERHTHMLDESVDLWKVGCLIFAVLTGLKPYYSIEHTEEKWDAIEQGPPYIDPRYETRSPIEARLVQIMRQCLQLDPSERANIFQVVQFLRETKRMYT